MLRDFFNGQAVKPLNYLHAKVKNQGTGQKNPKQTNSQIKRDYFWFEEYDGVGITYT